MTKKNISSNLSSNDIIHLREKWDKFEKSRIHGGVKEISTEDLEDLADCLNAAVDFLTIFPENEATRYWACVKEAEIRSIVHHRKFPL